MVCGRGELHAMSIGHSASHVNRPSRIMIVDEGGGESAILNKAIDDVEWNADVESIHSGKIAINTLYRNYAKQMPTDLVIMICLNDPLACLDFIRIIKNYPGISHQPIFVFSHSTLIDEIAEKSYVLGIIKVLEVSDNYSQTIMHIMEIKSHFTADGKFTPHGSWITCSRIATVKEMTGRIERRIMNRVREVSS